LKICNVIPILIEFANSEFFHIFVFPAAAKPADTTIQKCAPALIELSQDQKEGKTDSTVIWFQLCLAVDFSYFFCELSASCKMPEDMDKISVTVNSLSPDTQARQTVPEESSDDVFNLRTQDVIGQLSLKVNVGVFTNESTMDKNVLQFTKVESAVEEIFIDLPKDDVAEIEVMEDRHLSTQELLIVLDKTVSEKSLNGKRLFHLKIVMLIHSSPYLSG